MKFNLLLCMKSKEIAYLTRDGKLPLIEESLPNDTVEKSTCIYCDKGVLKPHICNNKSILGYHFGSTTLSFIILIIFAYIWLKFEIKHYKNKKW